MTKGRDFSVALGPGAVAADASIPFFNPKRAKQPNKGNGEGGEAQQTNKQRQPWFVS